MTYILAAIAALVLCLLTTRFGRRSLVHPPEALTNGARTNGAPAASWQTASQPAAAMAGTSPADVAVSVNLALQRLLPLMTSRRVRADVAVRPGLLVRISGAALVDLLEQLATFAIQDAQTSRLLLTAVDQGERVAITVTDDAPQANPDLRAGSIRDLAERVALSGDSLEVAVRPAEGTTMTLRLATAVGDIAAATTMVTRTARRPSGSSPSAARSGLAF